MTTLGELFTCIEHPDVIEERNKSLRDMKFTLFPLDKPMKDVIIQTTNAKTFQLIVIYNNETTTITGRSDWEYRLAKLLQLESAKDVIITLPSINIQINALGELTEEGSEQIDKAISEIWETNKKIKKCSN